MTRPLDLPVQRNSFRSLERGRARLLHDTPVMRAAVALSLVLLSSVASAEVSKKARSGDAASEYMLTESGDLFRQVGKLRCQVTNRVTDFKIAQHPEDAAAIYFVKDGDLRILFPPTSATGGCPKAEAMTVTPNVSRFTVVSDPRSPWFVMTLDGAGQFQAVGRDGALSVPGAQDFVMNACHGQSDRKFSSYSAFVLDRDGLVTRLKGREPVEKTDFARSYGSLEEFRNANGVCAPQ